MKNFTLKDVFIVSLVLAVAGMLIWFNFLRDPEVDNSQQIVGDLTEENEILSQGVKDSLALIPLYEYRIDSLQHLIAVEQRKFQTLNKEYEELIGDIDNNTVADDIELFSNYLSSREDDFR